MDDLTFTCPVCGADVPRRAMSCPDCGACEKSGWSQDRYLDGLNLPEENFDYDNFTALEFGGRSKLKQTVRQRLWLIVALVVIIAMVLLTLRGLW